MSNELNGVEAAQAQWLQGAGVIEQRSGQHDGIDPLLCQLRQTVAGATR
jgi:hypothetical protein